MSSTKCVQCGLVNFSTALQCKRCGQPLSELSGFADQRTYQQNVQPTAPVNNRQQFQPFQTPPPPPVFHGSNQSFNYQPQPPPNWCCIKCGSRNNVSMQNFKKSYLTPAAYLGLLIGPVIFLILALILRVKHYLTAPFCAECWSHFKHQPVISSMLSCACVFVIFGGLILGIAAEAPAFSFLSVVVGIGIGIGIKVYDSKVSPKFKKVNNNVVVIDAPTVGDVAFYR